MTIKHENVKGDIHIPQKFYKAAGVRIEEADLF